MTKDILVSIKGLQFESGNDEPVEMIASGEYFLKNGKHYVVYEEITEEDSGHGQGEISKNRIKVGKDQVEVMKRGATNVHMVFQKNQKTMTYYGTPFGQIMIGIFTNHIEVIEKEEVIEVKMDYDLDINQSFVSGCTITILIMSKDNRDQCF